MTEGFDPELSICTIQLDDLREEKRRADKEISRLRNLLLENNINCSSKPGDQGFISKTDDEASLPEVPHEILLLILSYAVTCSTPLTDPFYKGRAAI